MARGRLVGRALASSKKFNKELPGVSGKLLEWTQLLYVMLQPQSDDFGRLQGDPWTVKTTCLPASKRPEGDFEKALGYLHKVGLINWYERENRLYIQIENFDEIQTGLHKRTKSKYPGPLDSSRKFPEIPSEEKGTEEKGREGKGVKPSPPKEEKKAVADAVTMTDRELAKLEDAWGKRQARILIEVLNNYKSAHNKKYASDYHAILNWVVGKCEERGLIRRPTKVDTGVPMCGVCRKAAAEIKTDRGTVCEDCYQKYFATEGGPASADIPDIWYGNTLLADQSEMMLKDMEGSEEDVPELPRDEEQGSPD